jgi:hypothetical protein
MLSRQLSSVIENWLNVMNLDWNLHGRWGKLVGARSMVMVVVMRRPLNMVMMMYGLSWPCLWYTGRSPIQGSCYWYRWFFVCLVVMVVMMMVTILLARILSTQGFQRTDDGVGGGGGACSV